MPGDPLYYPYPSRRTVLYGANGMVATSQPLAAQAGLAMLREGGNAVDAAIATAACLTVVEPTCNGIGGDAFAQVWMDGKLYGLNASGPAPALLNAAAARKSGHSIMPRDGLLPITVPGIPAAWAALHQRFGQLPFTRVLQHAIDYADRGFPVSPTTAELWHAAHDHYSTLADAALRHWFAAFAPAGRAPLPGEIWRFPEQVRTLEAIAQSHAAAFYRGPLAERIDMLMRQAGGYLRGEDLADFVPEWVDPVSTDYAEHEVWELPPNGHGIIALMALNILRNFDMTERDSPETTHRLIEAVKLAFADGLAHIADPSAMQADISVLLSANYAEQQAARIGDRALEPTPGEPHAGGTVYLAAADGQGGMISYIQSNYTGFGSGVVVPGTGIALHNRGACFSLKDGHPNCIAPGKRPYHTIIPGFLTRKGVPVGPFGMMGGFIQPQGHVMLIHRMLDNGLNPQAALDAPRFRWVRGREVDVEVGFPSAVAEALRRKGHVIRYGAVGDKDFGRGQIIQRTPDGKALIGGTEGRTDGQVAAW